jgi:hypothetical protein
MTHQWVYFFHIVLTIIAELINCSGKRNGRHATRFALTLKVDNPGAAGNSDLTLLMDRRKEPVR